MIRFLISRSICLSSSCCVCVCSSLRWSAQVTHIITVTAVSHFHWSGFNIHTRTVLMVVIGDQLVAELHTLSQQDVQDMLTYWAQQLTKCLCCSLCYKVCIPSLCSGEKLPGSWVVWAHSLITWSQAHAQHCTCTAWSRSKFKVMCHCYKSNETAQQVEPV